MDRAGSENISSFLFQNPHWPEPFCHGSLCFPHSANPNDCQGICILVYVLSWGYHKALKLEELICSNAHEGELLKVGIRVDVCFCSLVRRTGRASELLPGVEELCFLSDISSSVMEYTYTQNILNKLQGDGQLFWEVLTKPSSAWSIGMLTSNMTSYRTLLGTRLVLLTAVVLIIFFIKLAKVR